MCENHATKRLSLVVVVKISFLSATNPKSPLFTNRHLTGFLSFIHLKGFAWDGSWAARHDTGPNTITVWPTKRGGFGDSVKITSQQAIGNAFTLHKDHLFVVSSLGGLSVIVHDLSSLNDLNMTSAKVPKVISLADRVHWDAVDRTFCYVLEDKVDVCVVMLIMKSGEILVTAVDVKSGVLSQSFKIGE